MPAQEWALGADLTWRRVDGTELFSRDQLVYGTYQPGPETTGAYGPLTAHAGDYITSADNEVIEGLDITGQIVVNHDGVTIRNCRIRSRAYPGGTWAGVQCWSVNSPVTRIIDCTIEADSHPEVGQQTGVHGRDYVAERCEVRGYVDGFKASYGNVQILGCWVHTMPWYSFDPNQVDGSHNDGIQVIGDVAGTGGFVFRGNRIESGYKGTSAVIVTQPSGTQVDDLVIDRNWLLSTEATRADATATGINLSQQGTADAMTNVAVTDNVFSPWDASDGSGWRIDHDGLVDAETYDAATITGNTWTDLSTAAKISRVNG